MLLAQGVRPDDVVGIQLPNVKELAACYLALARIGAIASPFPIQYRSHELGQLGRLAEVRRSSRRHASASDAQPRSSSP